MYQATVPVFRHYLSRISDLVAIAGPEALDAPSVENLTARQHFEIAAGLAMRVPCLLTGREMQDLPQALGPRLAVTRARLGAMKAEDFVGAEARSLADPEMGLVQPLSAPRYLFDHALPLFFFHMTLGYAALRQAGVDLTPSDFDGMPRAVPLQE